MTELVVGATVAGVVLLLGRVRPHPPLAPAAPVASTDDWVRRGRRWWPVLGFMAGWAFAGGTTGLVVGALAAAVVHRVASRAEPASARRDRESATRDLPALVLLLATAVRAGSATGPAVRQACAALPGPAADRLGAVADQLALGVDPEQAWTRLVDDPALAPLGRALARAERTGAPVSGIVERLADDLADSARAEVEDRARAVGVRAAVPLGVCLLPAFLLLGIVPLVASLISGIRL